MNILILSWRDPKHPLAGGAEQSVLEHAKGWINAGYSVTWFSSRFGGSLANEEISGIRVIRAGYQYLGVQISAFIYFLKNRNKFDLVVDQFHGIPFFTPLYVRKPKLALVQETAGKVWFLNPLPKPLNWVVGLLGYVSEPLIFKLYKRTSFMTASVSAKEDINKMGIPLGSIAIIPHGVTLPNFKVGRRDSKILTITYLGTLSKDKGVEDALKCFSILNKLDKFRFWVIGKPDTDRYMGLLRRLSLRYGLEKSIKFWGYVSQEKKFELLSSSWILVNPSVHEGWGLVNIEANSAGVPVIAYKSQGLIDSVSDGKSGIILKNNSPDDMAKMLLNLSNDKNLYKKLQEGAILWSKKFSWKKSQSMSLKLIQKILGRHE